MRKIIAISLALAILLPEVSLAQYVGGGSGSGGGGSGTVTSIATGCQATGGTITTTGTISTSITPTALSAANAPIVTAYCGGIENFTQATNDAPTIAVAGSAGFATGWFTDLCNTVNNTKTLTPASGTIGGAATYVFPAATAAAPACIRIVADGPNTNYIVESSASAATTNASLLTSGTLAAARLPALTGDVTETAGTGVTVLAAGSASNLNSGTLPAGRMPALTGDCATTAGAVATNCNSTPFTGFQTNFWYKPYGILEATGTAYVANTISCFFGGIPQKGTVQGLGVGVSAGAGTNATGAIYANTNSRPGAIIGNVGTTAFSVATTGTKTAALAVNKNLGPGGTDGGRDVWWCTNADGTPTFSAASNSAASSFGSAMIGSATASNVINGTAMAGVTCTGANCTGGSSTCCTWPATLAGSTWTEATNTKIPSMIYEVVP